MGFGSFHSMLLSTRNSEYALQLQSVKTICCRYKRQSMCLLILFCDSKSHFHQFKLIKTMVKSLHILLGGIGI